MKYKSLGKTDLKVSLICLGTMTWGEQNTQDEAFEQMDYSIDQDVNFLIRLNCTPFPRRQKPLRKQRR